MRCAVAGPCRRRTAGSAVLVVDANTGRVLHQSSADEPALSGLARQDDDALSRVRADRAGPPQLPAPRSVLGQCRGGRSPPSSTSRRATEIALIDAIKALITKSANDVAVAVAEHIAGSEERFAQTDDAEGAPARHDARPPSECLRAARSRAGHDRARHGHAGAAGCRTISRGTTRCLPRAPSPTTARPSATTTPCCSATRARDGLKTGYTRASGFNLVASVRRGRKHVVGAVFGGATAAQRNAAMRTYLNIGLVKASKKKRASRRRC